MLWCLGVWKMKPHISSMWVKGFQSQNAKKKSIKVLISVYHKYKPHMCMHWVFHKALHNFEAKNSVSSNNRIELSDIQVASIMSWLSVNSSVFSLDRKIHFNWILSWNYLGWQGRCLRRVLLKTLRNEPTKLL